MTLKETKMPVKEGTYSIIVCTAVGAFLVVLLLQLQIKQLSPVLVEILAGLFLCATY